MEEPTVVLTIYDDGIETTRDGKPWGSQVVEPNVHVIEEFMRVIRAYGYREYTVRDERTDGRPGSGGMP